MSARAQVELLTSRDPAQVAVALDSIEERFDLPEPLVAALVRFIRAEHGAPDPTQLARAKAAVEREGLRRLPEWAAARNVVGLLGLELAHPVASVRHRAGETLSTVSPLTMEERRRNPAKLTSRSSAMRVASVVPALAEACGVAVGALAAQVHLWGGHGLLCLTSVMTPDEFMGVVERFGLHWSRELWLSHLDLGTLSPRIASLDGLRSLVLTENLLTGLPAELGALPLEALDVSSNRLTVMPDVVYGLTELRSLDLSLNSVRSVDERLTRLTKLTVFRATGCALELPADLSALTQLDEVWLTAAGRLPKGLQTLGRLRRLMLSASPAKPLSLEGAFERGYDALVHLDASYSGLRSLPDDLGRLRNLELLYLHGNEFSAVPQTLVELVKLRRLSLGQGALPSAEVERVRRRMPWCSVTE